jgi:NADH/NAD ratio-sensing transcriptional regulator Rex
MKKDNLEDRHRQKCYEGQLLWELQNGFELSPRESELIIDTVRLYYQGSYEDRRGKLNVYVVRKDSSVGKPLSEIPKIEVSVTYDGGLEDLESYHKFGHAGLRRQKILRITEEILDQGGLATQEDLANILGASVRTIRRDIGYFRKLGMQIITRGVYSDIGRTTSHKVVIVEMYLSGFVYTEICRRTRHSAKAVKRYVNTFVRIITLYEKGIKTASELSRYIGISERLASEYLELYFKVGKKPGCEARIKDIMAQLSSRRNYSGGNSFKKRNVVGGMRI